MQFAQSWIEEIRNSRSPGKPENLGAIVQKITFRLQNRLSRVLYRQQSFIGFTHTQPEMHQAENRRSPKIRNISVLSSIFAVLLFSSCVYLFLSFSHIHTHIRTHTYTRAHTRKFPNIYMLSLAFV